MASNLLSSEIFLSPLGNIQGKPTLNIAFSGGMDSHVLLHYLAHEPTLRKTFMLRAIHVNHHISPHANTWQETCEKLAKDYGIEYATISVDVVKGPGESLEALAREARYHALEAFMGEGDYLVTAHHQEDQTETFLLQLFRGAGIKGLSAMPLLIGFNKGFHYRPFLSLSREMLREYALSHKLTWIEDESNAQVSFDRNYLRHEVLPLIQKRWPAVSSTVTRSAQHCANAQILLEDMQAEKLSSMQCVERKTLCIPSVLSHSEIEQGFLIRAWLQGLELPLPSLKKIQEIQKTVLHSRSDANPCVTWEGVEVRRHDQQLYAMKPLRPHDKDAVIKWNLQLSLELPSVGLTLSLKMRKGQGLRIINPESITVRFRQGGEKIRLQGHSMRRTLKNLYQEWNIPCWQRDRIPFLYEGNELLAIVGYGVSHEHCVSNSEEGYEIFSL